MGHSSCGGEARLNAINLLIGGAVVEALGYVTAQSGVAYLLRGVAGTPSWLLCPLNHDGVP